MVKVPFWLKKQLNSENAPLLWMTLLAGLFTFYAFRYMYFGRDTIYIGFYNFLYFSDSLKTGIVPFWNPFTFAGTHFVNFNNVGIFSPFQLVFVFLSWVINPFYAYECMLKCIVLSGGLGSYLLFITLWKDKYIALFGAIAYVLSVLASMAGQVAFMISFAGLPWLLYGCVYLTRLEKVQIQWPIFIGALWFFFAISGYLWMNLVHLSAAGLFSSYLCYQAYQAKKPYLPAIIHSSCYLLLILFLYICWILPGYWAMSFNYGLFQGDFISQEPTLRGLGYTESYAYPHLFTAWLNAVDPMILARHGALHSDLPRRFVGAGLVAPGAGMIVWIMFFLAPFKRSLRHISLLIVCVLALLYASGQNGLKQGILAIPILNANRWWFIGTAYASIAVIFSVTGRLSTLKHISVYSKSYMIKVLGVSVGLLSLLYVYAAPPLSFYIAINGIVLVSALGWIKQDRHWKNILMVLMVLNLMAFFLINHNGFSTGDDQLNAQINHYAKQVAARTQSVIVLHNKRRIGLSKEYQYADASWLFHKIPFSHGFDNLSHPLYWYVKNSAFLERIIWVTQQVRQAKHITRQSYSSDNDFAKALMNDVLENPEQPIIDSKEYRQLPQDNPLFASLPSVRIEPNKVNVHVFINAASFLIFNNLYVPGWHVYVNGQPKSLLKTNRLFQGVFLEKAGDYQVVFKFSAWPIILVLSIPYLILFCVSAIMFVHLKQEN